MENAELRDYFKQYKASLTNLNDRAKARFFINFLSSYMGTAALDNPNIFAVLDKDFFLDSINAYIDEKKPKISAARDYRRTIFELCNDACEKYSIVNTFLDSISERKYFDEKTDELFEHLDKSESRECMSSEAFEILDETINDFFNTTSLDRKIMESIQNIRSRPNYYGWLVSAIALNLIRYFGLDNKMIPIIKVADVNLEDSTISINGFSLPLNESLIAEFQLYLKFRDIVIRAQKKQTDTLFIKRNGADYCDINGRPASNDLFLILVTIFGSANTSGLRYRTITELLSKGANINLLHQLTAVDQQTIIDLCTEDKASFENIFQSKNNADIYVPRKNKKGQIRCPYCGNSRDASSENWILIQIVGDKKKYLACRECRGLDGKYKY